MTTSRPVTPTPRSAISRAAVPLDVAVARRAACAAANAASKLRVYGPSVSAPLARISSTALAISVRSARGKTTRAAGTPNGLPFDESCPRLGRLSGPPGAIDYATIPPHTARPPERVAFQLWHR